MNELTIGMDERDVDRFSEGLEAFEAALVAAAWHDDALDEIALAPAWGILNALQAARRSKDLRADYRPRTWARVGAPGAQETIEQQMSELDDDDGWWEPLGGSADGSDGPVHSSLWFGSDGSLAASVAVRREASELWQTVTWYGASSELVERTEQIDGPFLEPIARWVAVRVERTMTDLGLDRRGPFRRTRQASSPSGAADTALNRGTPSDRPLADIDTHARSSTGSDR